MVYFLLFTPRQDTWGAFKFNAGLHTLHNIGLKSEILQNIAKKYIEMRYIFANTI
jgi:hypothetical protein